MSAIHGSRGCTPRVEAEGGGRLEVPLAGPGGTSIEERCKEWVGAWGCRPQAQPYTHLAASLLARRSHTTTIWMHPRFSGGMRVVWERNARQRLG